MGATEFITAYWPLIAAGLGAMLWFARLEAKVLYIEKDRDRESLEIMKRLDAGKVQMEKLADGFTEMKVTLARIEGHFKKDE